VTVLWLAALFFAFTCLPALASPGTLHPERAPGAAATVDDGARVVPPEAMDGVRDRCLDWLEEALGMAIERDFRCVYEPLDRIRLSAGERSVAYSTFRGVGGRLEATVHVALGQPLDRTVHAFTHELVHVWLHQRGVDCTRTTAEGFAEWAAWHHLEALGLEAEARVIEGNLVDGYARGFRRIQTLSARVGLRSTVLEVARGQRAAVAR
jgi:hypothetical protein